MAADSSLTEMKTDVEDKELTHKEEMLKFLEVLENHKQKENQSLDDYLKNLKQQTIKMLEKSSVEEDQDTELDIPKKFRTIIQKNVKKYKSLQEIVFIIEKKFSETLNSSDRAYIERKFVMCCLDLYMNEVVLAVKTLVRANNFNNIQELLIKLNSTEHFDEIPDQLQGNFYKLLTTHKKASYNILKNDFLNRMKSACFVEISNFSEVVNQEIQLIEKIVEFLNNEENFPDIINSLQLNELCQGVITFQKFLKNLIDLNGYVSDIIKSVKDLANILVTKENLLMVDAFKQIIHPYTKPPELKETLITGRNVIQVTGKIIDLMTVLKDVENKILNNKRIEEVHFIATVFYATENLEQNVWHGVNIVVYVKTLKVTRKVTWNISGNSCCIIKSKASDGQTPREEGASGTDGDAGESGGNVLIISNKIEQQDNLHIESNGGDGAPGQSGGNGADGEDGIGITIDELDKRYPSAALLINSKSRTNRNITLRNIGTNTPFYDNDSREIFIETFIDEGRTITFSYYFNLLWRGSLTLVNGSRGKPSGRGGKGGLGGEGGYAGDIIINNKKFGESKDGNDGSNGEMGQYGLQGKNGWDIGYVDYIFWQDAKYYGKDENSKLKLDYSDVSASDRIWCPKKKKYVKIIHLGKPDRIITEYKEETNSNIVRRREKTDRKKALTAQNIVSTYSHPPELILQIKNDLIKTLDLLDDNKHHQKKQDIELTIKYQYHHIGNSKNFSRKKSIQNNDNTNQLDQKNDSDTLVNEIEINQVDLENWEKLKTVQLNDENLNKLHSILKALKSNDKLLGRFINKIFSMWKSNQTVQKIEKFELDYIANILTKKYQINMFKNIANMLPVYFNDEKKIGMPSGNFDRQLIEADQNYKNISHNFLGILRQYFYKNGPEQRHKISSFYKNSNNFQDNSETFETAIKTFILHAGESINVHETIKNYYENIQEFLNQCKSKIIKHSEEFRNEISKPEYAMIMTLWSKSISDGNIEIIEEIEKYRILKELYNQFNEQEKYNWEKCYNDNIVLKEYSEHIQREGVLSKSCREFLAYAYDVNINIYIKNKTDNYSLQDSHNPLSKNKLHILYIDNIFLEMKIDEDYLLLENDRIKRNELYASIFTDIDSLKTKETLEKYFRKKSFLSNDLYYSDELCQTYDSYQNMNELEQIEKIKQYFSNEEKQNIENFLKTILSQYIGQHRILDHLSNRFENEGRHISFKELYYFINSILKSVVTNNHELNLYCWIIAAYPQEKWICELILLELENFFKKQLPDKSKWRQNLSEIKDVNILLLFFVKIDQLRPNNSISIEKIGNILNLLHLNLNENYLDNLDLSDWVYALKENYWKYKLNSLTKWTEGKLKEATYYILTLENNAGNVLVEGFINVLDKKDKLDEKEYLNILLRFKNEEWNLCKNSLEMLQANSIGKWINKMQADIPSANNDRNVTQLVKLIEGNGNTSERIKKLLPSIKTSIRETKSPEYSHNNRKIYDFTGNDIKNWAEDFRNNLIDKDNVTDMYAHMFAVINRGIELKMGFKLRDTQSLSIMMLLQNKHSTLLQMLTGEGKTLIIVAATIVKVLCGEQVDIVTSSSVLAKRDAESNKAIYDLFGVKVSHNCSEVIEERKQTYANNDVVYGDLANFQRDYLLDSFYKENVLSNRKFENIFIDEVDSLLLDKGNNVLYLSRDIPGLDKLESVYFFIWLLIRKPTIDKDELTDIFDTKKIKEAVISDLYGLITKNNIKQLDTKLTDLEVYKIWKKLINLKIVDMDGKLISEKIDYDKVEELFSTEFGIYVDRIKFMLRQCAERDRFIKVPNYLKSFVLDHLESWIESAKSAMFMQERSNYIIDVDNSGTSSDIYPNVIILDKDTGTDQLNSQWDEALHQFLQLKHGCKLSLQSLKAVFISNVSYFKRYSKMHGLTGTLGSQKEKELLNEMYKIDFINIPTTKLKLFEEKSPVLCSEKSEWKENIYEESLKMINIKRSVLVICETVEDVDMLYSYFKEKNVKNIDKYTRDYEHLDLITKENERLACSHIILATNLAGRGTDIKITKELNSAGGLHVILSYLPNNIRIEHQAFGRAARAGDKGSGQLIIMGRYDKGYDSFKIVDLKKERDIKELQILVGIKEYYNTQIKTEEYCFEKFTTEYRKWKLYIQEQKLSSDIRDVLLHSCLNRWSFWLDQNSSLIKTLKGEQLDSKIKQSLSIFISELQKLLNETKWSIWAHGPFQKIKLAKCFINNRNIDEAISLFNQVIQEEPNFSELAHYYKAFAISKKINWKGCSLKDHDKTLLIELKREFKEAQKLFDQHNEFSIEAGSIIDTFKQHDKNGFLQPEAYKKQKANLSYLYSIFSKSIDNILGHCITPQCFIDENIKEAKSDILFCDLQKVGILTKPVVNAETSEETIRKIAFEYGVSVKDINTFLSKYKNKSMDEIELKEKMKDCIKLPSRESFWERLKENNILYEEVVYACLDKKRIKNINPFLFDSILIKTTIYTIELLENETNILYLYPEHIKLQNEQCIIVKNCDLKNIISIENYKMLESAFAISFNKKAFFRNNQDNLIIFSDFDNITKNEFLNVNITDSESEEILKYLVKENHLGTTDNINFSLKIPFDKIDYIELNDFPIYKDIVKQLLHLCFTYRKTFEKLQIEFENKEQILTQINLISKPYQKLFFDMVDSEIIIPSKISHNSLDIHEQLKNVNPRFYVCATIDNIAKKIKQYSSLLQTLQVPNFNLKSLAEYFDNRSFGNIDEVRLFTLNGLDKVIILHESKYTSKMIWNTTVVMFMGIIQISIGAVMELYSKGLMFAVSSLCIKEGINDLIYAIGAFVHGLFDWNDYLIHKLKSLAISTLTIVETWFLKGIPKLAYGSKITVPTEIIINGKEVAKMHGNELIEAVRYKQIIKAVGKRTLNKTVEGLTLSFKLVKIDHLLEKYINSFHDKIINYIINTMFTTLQVHRINETLDDLFDKLGEQQGMEMVKKLTNNLFSENEQFSKYIALIYDGTKVILDIIKKTFEISDVEMFIKILKMILQTQKPADIVINVSFFMSFFDELNNKIITELYSSGDTCVTDNIDILKRDIFKENVNSFWKKILKKKIEKEIKMQQSTQIIMKQVRKQIQNVYRKVKEPNNHSKLHNMEQMYQKALFDIREGKENVNLKTHINSKHNENVLKLLLKTGNPNLFATIIKENYPMDLLCIDACTLLVKQILNCDITIIARGDNGLSQTFSTSQNEEATTVLELNLENNQFSICNTVDDDNTSPKPELKNNCLYEALPKEVRSKISPETFRNKIIAFIESNNQVTSTIKLPLNPMFCNGSNTGDNLDYSLKDSIEKISQYQHDTWKFNEKNDKDLRVDGTKVDTMKQLTNGLKLAFNKVQELIKEKHPENKININELKVKKYDEVYIWKNDQDDVVTTFKYNARFPVEFYIDKKFIIDGIELKYRIEINIDNPEYVQHGPNGPHISYSISGPKNSSWEHVVSYILLNKNTKLPSRTQSGSSVNIRSFRTDILFENSICWESRYIIEKKININDISELYF